MSHRNASTNADADRERQQRTCRACDQTYEYPVPKSLATRFYCERCVELPATTRSTLEGFNKRIKTLARSLERLEQGLQSTQAVGQSPPVHTETGQKNNR